MKLRADLVTIPRSIAVLLLLAGQLTFASVWAGCFTYGPEVVSIRGKLIRKTFAGPPNYTSIKQGDEAETGYYLIPVEPVCTLASSNDEPAQNVKLIQLVLSQTNYAKLKSQLGKSLQVKGTLFAAHTGHHHAPLLLNFREATTQ